jgi:hypothetical protein
MDPGRLHELRLAAGERLGVGLPGGHENLRGSERNLARVERLLRVRHLLQAPRRPQLGLGLAPADLERRREPRRRRQVAVAAVDASALDLGQVTQALGLEQLGGALQLREVLFQHRVGLVRDIAVAERVDVRLKSTHESTRSRGYDILRNHCSARRFNTRR